MPTIRQIANEAGVSVGTVSNVLNKPEIVSEEVRDRVIKIMKKHHYRPSAIARSLSTKRTSNLGLIVSLYPTPFYTDLAQGAIEAARECGCGLMVVATDYEASDLPEQIDHLIRQWVDGIFIATQPVSEKTLQKIPKSETPLVFMDRGQIPTSKTVGMVGFDWQAGAYEATNHLIGLGHSRIGYVGGIPGRSSSILRERGYVQALTNANLPYDPELIREGDFFTESGYKHAVELLSLPNPPTALFMANDMMALGALHAIQERKLHIPEDISILGVDDVFFTQYLSPPLTTVRVPTKEAGRIGIEILLKAAYEGQDIQRILLPTSLIVRNSTGSVPAARQ